MANGKGLLSQGQKEQALYKGLLQLGAQLSAGSGGNRPVSTLQALSQGGAGFGQAYGQSVDAAKNRAMQQREMDYQDEVRKRESDKLASQAAYRMSLPPSVRQQAEVMGVPQFAAAEYAQSQKPKAETFATVNNPFGKGGVYQQSSTTGKMDPVYTPPKAAKVGAPVKVIGEGGKPTYVNPLDAIGKTPWVKPTASKLLSKEELAQKITIAEASAGAKPLNESQAKAGGFALRMDGAEANLQTVLAGKDGKMGTADDYDPTNVQDQYGGDIPVVGGYVRSNQGQLFEQAQRDWVTANLRKESGAVIGEDEMANEIKKYFPQPSDGVDVISQKARSRARAMAGMKAASGKGYQQMKDEYDKYDTSGGNVGSVEIDSLVNKYASP